MSNRSQLDKVGSIQRLRLLEFIKQSDGTTVAEIAKKFKLSYMGAQGHVRLLENGGLIEATLQRERVGRPQRIFRPSEKGHAIFEPEPMLQLQRTLDAVAAIYGANGPEKVLYALFQNLQKEYASKAKAADAPTRLGHLVKLREKEGAMPKLVKSRSGKAFTLTEFHPPFGALEPLYPVIARLEQELVEGVIKLPVRRSVLEIGGSRTVTFQIGAVED